jgi:methionyl-tRNA formyltransferase
MALRIAIFGQAPFGKDVTQRLAEAGHEIVGVYVPPDQGRPDPLAALAEERGWTLFRHKRFRRKGKAIPELVEEYRSLGAELNVFPFTTVILPPEIVDGPRHGSLVFHPSLLPAFRGGASLSWQIILGAEESGVTVFRADAGVDTGPIVVQHGGVPIEATDTMGSLYFDKLYAMGVEATLEAVAAVDGRSARFSPQGEEGASEQGLVTEEVARVDWSRPAAAVERLIRGCDPSPGAWTELEGECVRLFGGAISVGYRDRAADAELGSVIGVEKGRLVVAANGGAVSIAKVRRGEEKKTPSGESGIAPGARFS